MRMGAAGSIRAVSVPRRDIVAFASIRTFSGQGRHVATEGQALSVGGGLGPAEPGTARAPTTAALCFEIGPEFRRSQMSLHM
jgi:hypothetical protein